MKTYLHVYLFVAAVICGITGKLFKVSEFSSVFTLMNKSSTVTFSLPLLTHGVGGQIVKYP